MEPVTNETRKLRILLNKFTRIIFIHPLELHHIHLYLLGKVDSPDISRTSDLYESVIYLRELAEFNNFKSLDDFIGYFEVQSRELTEFLQPYLISNPPTPKVRTPTSSVSDPAASSPASGTETRRSPATTRTYQSLLYSLYKYSCDSRSLSRQIQSYRKLVGYQRNSFDLSCFGRTSDDCSKLFATFIYHYFKGYTADSIHNRPASALTRLVGYFKRLLRRWFENKLWKVLVHANRKDDDRKVQTLCDNLYTTIKAEKSILNEDIKIMFSGILFISEQNDFSISYEEANDRATKMYHDYYCHKRWAILKSPEGCGWLASSNPVVTVNVDKQPVIYLPLTSRHCLRLCPEFGASPANRSMFENAILFEPSSEKELALVNSNIISSLPKVIINTENAIMFHNKHDL